MDLQEHHELIFGEEFCFPATTTYYPPLYGPTGDGSSVRTQEYRAETVEHTYHQPVPTPHYPALPSAVDRTPATTAQSLAYTNGLFVPGGLKQTVAVASESGTTALASSMEATILWWVHGAS
uniref:Uncharacterized protein n=1 Tax=Setaria italica TaxID=4555 RepID=K3YE60_SETIT